MGYFTAGQKVQVFSPEGVKMAQELLVDQDFPIWHSTASVQTSEGQIHWFVAGTSPEWREHPGLAV